MNEPNCYCWKCGWGCYSFKSIQCPNCDRELDCPNCGGLGSWIEKQLGSLGRGFKQAFKKTTGRDCGCDKRKQRLNELGKKLGWSDEQ